MALSTSSSIPDDLIKYGDVGGRIDNEIKSKAIHLTAILENFERNCTESAFRLNVSFLGHEMRTYSDDCVPFDFWVRQVGLQFEYADSFGFMYESLEQLIDQPNLAWGVLGDAAALMFHASRLYFDIVQGLVKNREVTKSAFREFGRVLNAITEQRGNVGLLDKAYRLLVVKEIPYQGSIDSLLKSGWLDGGLVAADALFGFINDVNQGTYGDDYVKAGGVNTIDAGIQYGIALHPVGAITLITNSVLQIGGNFQVGVQRTLADLFAVDAEMGTMLQQDAAVVADAVEKSNLGNITKEISEGIYTNISDRFTFIADSAQLGVQSMSDLWQDPSWQTLESVMEKQKAFNLEHKWDILAGALGPATSFLIPTSEAGWVNYGEAGLAAVNVVDGLADWSMATSSSVINQSVNVGAQYVNNKPFVPNFMKDAVTEGAKEYVAWLQGKRDWAIDLIDY